MGDPTTEPKRDSADGQDGNSDVEIQSDNEDHEAEQIDAGNVNGANEHDYATLTPVDNHANSMPTYRQNERLSRNGGYQNPNADTVHSILSSISNPNAAIVIPMDEQIGDGGEAIDADRMARFYSGALSAITKMRRQTQKTETKIDTLRTEVGHSTMQAWTEEHYDSVRPAAKQ